MKITSLTEFQRFKSENEGYFVVTRKNAPTHIHLVKCWFVRNDDFYKKVIVNKNKNGEYFWFNLIPEALNEFPELLSCRHCNLITKGKLQFFAN